MLIATLSLVPFCLGLSRVPGWALGILPGLSLALGIWATASEPPGYDMPWFGLYVYGGLAVILLLATLAGRWVRVVFIHPRPPRSSS